MHTLAKYLTELSLGDYHMLEFTPSLVAAAALNLSIRVLGDTTKCNWVSYSCHTHTPLQSSLTQPPCLKQNSGYTISDLAPCLRRLAQLLLKVPLLPKTRHAVVDKYNSEEFFCISQEPCLLSKTVRQLAA